MDEVVTALGEKLFQVAQLLITEQTLTADLDRILRSATELISGCDGATVSLIVEGEPTTAAASDRIVLDMDLAQYEDQDGPCLDAAEEDRIVSMQFVSEGDRYPHVARAADSNGVTASLSFPVRTTAGPIGSLNLYSRHPDGFIRADRAVGSVLAAQVAAALVKSRLLASAEEFIEEAQVESERRSRVAMAEGVLMAIEECTLEQARALIASASDSEGRTVLETADAILSTLGRSDHDLDG